MLIVLSYFLQAMMYILLCHFFLTAAKKLVGKERTKLWKKVLIGVGIVAYVILIVSSAILSAKALFNGKSVIFGCKTDFFWLSDLSLLLILCVFAYDAWEISAVIN